MFADFIEETTTSIAGSSGDGAVTLTQVTGLPRFSNPFGSAARLVRYVIEDTVLSKFEQGIGSVAANVLTRTSPRVTWDGTTFDDADATAIQFGSTPTSGNVRIRMAPVSDSFYPSIPVTVQSVGDDVGLASAHAIGVGNSGSAQGYTADTEFYAPFVWIGGGGDVLQATVRQQAGVTASTGLKWGIFQIGANGLPGDAIAIFNTVNASVATGLKKDSTTATWTPAGTFKLPVGHYWLGWITNSATPTWQTYLQGAGSGVLPSTLGWQGVASSGYAASCCLRKSAGSNTYATGLPSNGSSSGTLVITSTQYAMQAWLKARN